MVEDTIIATAGESTKTGKVYSLEELQECAKGDSRLYLIGLDLWMDPTKVTRPSKEASTKVKQLLDETCKCWIRHYSKGEWEIVVWWIKNYGQKDEKECEYRKSLTPLELSRLLYIFDYGSLLDKLLQDILKGYKFYGG